MPTMPPGTKRVDVYLPPDLADRLTNFLQSEALGRVPKGAWNAFVLQRVREFFDLPRVPTHQYAGFPRDGWLTGSPEAIRQTLEQLAHLRSVPDGMDEAFPELNPSSVK